MATLLDLRLPIRFWDKVSPCPVSGCWLWTGAITSQGYGSMGVDGKTVNTHRHAYLMLVGEIENGLELDHKCRVRRCVNPDHMEPVTKQINIARGEAGANWAAKTHCPRGHAYSDTNTYLTPKGKRICRRCRLAAKQRHRTKLRQEIQP